MRIAVWRCVLIGSVMSFGGSSAQGQAAPGAPAVKPAAQPATKPVMQPAAAKPDATKPTAATPADKKQVPTGKAAGGAAVSAQSESLAIAQERLQSGDEATVRAALASLMQLGGEPAAQLVSARLRRGLPPLLIEAAVDALVLLDRASAGPVLLELTQHRRMQVRVKVMQALAALRVRSAQSALLYALDDPNTEVRGAAVEALASVGNARALPALYTAAERGVPGAWLAVGTIAGPADFKTLLAHAHAADVAPMRPALDTLMRRSNLPVDAKLRVAQLVQGLGSSSARECLSDWADHLPADTAPRLRQGLGQFVHTFVEKNIGHAAALAAAPAKPDAAAAAHAAPSAKPAPVTPAHAAAPAGKAATSTAQPARGAASKAPQVADAHSADAPAAKGESR
jgi:hypothetical protein